MEQLVSSIVRSGTSTTVGEISPPASVSTNWAKKNPAKYISTLRELKTKYDLVWQIEIGGGEQRFICYNAGDDPEALALKFVKVEQLPHQYYEKILHFIRTQIERAKIDPNLSHIFLPNRRKAPISKHFPYMGDPYSYTTAKFPQILKKIVDFNEILQTDHKTVAVSLSPNEIEILSDMVTKLEQCLTLDCHYLILDKLIEWPMDKIFPGLDLIRMVMDNPISIKYFQMYPIFVFKLLSIVKKEVVSPTNLFLILKSIVNIQKRDAERVLLKLCYNDIITILEIASFMDNTNVHNCLSSAMLNFTLLTADIMDSKQRWVSILLRAIQNTTDFDSLRRLLVALGSLLYKESQLCKTIYVLPEYKTIEKLSNSLYEEKIRECAQDINTLVFLFK